jgi:hypothetical protein
MHTCYDCGRLFVSNYDLVNHDCATQEIVERRITSYNRQNPKELRNVYPRTGVRQAVVRLVADMRNSFGRLPNRCNQFAVRALL